MERTYNVGRENRLVQKTIVYRGTVSQNGERDGG